MLEISKDFLTNQTFESTMTAFNRQMPTYFGDPEHAVCLPNGAVVQTDGKVQLSFYAPAATTVTATNYQSEVTLTKGSDGVWTGTLLYTEPGFKPLEFRVDGNAVLNCAAPLGFGSDRAVNFVEIPDMDCEFLLLKNVPHGAVTRELYYSSVTGQYESCLVYTPPGYQKENREYPVLYLQHGGGENENCWVYQGKIHNTMDNLLAEKKAEPMLIVMNNNMVQMPAENGARKIDFAAFEEMLLKDCIPFIEGKYRVKADKWNRAVAGLSMGSLQSGEIIMRHMDLFAYAGLFTGFLYPFRPVEENDFHVLDDAETFNREVKVFFRAMGDQEVSIPLFGKEREICAERGVHTIEKIYPGGHEWRVWRNSAHDFLQLIFRS